ncbi:MAG: 4-(cytidine 5'-diphospho)-2-C-methyl-D-erythritol kinase [Lachnospiraceae bacterium]|nr:4-(cytidine 5'-diphospho)-2-C-methyl-D-erythritol kinase [Lachnospiraceae bacterium]
MAYQIAKGILFRERMLQTDKLELKAPGKINLGLDVLGKREDGYHEIKTIMQTVWLCDDIILRKTAHPGIELQSNLDYLPDNETNLAYKAAALLMEEFKIKTGVDIKLYKHIPVAAGMAGGSADAAAVLFGINKLFSLGLSYGDLTKRAEVLGADVPYCVLRGTYLCTGKGEVMERLPYMPHCSLVIVKPAFSVATKKVFEQYDYAKDIVHPDLSRLIGGLEKGDLKEIAAGMGNVLEQVTAKHHPVITRLKESLIRLGALNAIMSGSGPTVFGIFDDDAKARRAAKRLHFGGLNSDRKVYCVGVHHVRRNNGV